MNEWRMADGLWHGQEMESGVPKRRPPMRREVLPDIFFFAHLSTVAVGW